MTSIYTTFDDIYRERRWGYSSETRSGAGSTAPAVQRVVHYIKGIIDHYHIHSIGDICGDFAWQGEIVKHRPHVLYHGYDVSELALFDAVAKAKDQGLGHRTTFTTKDLSYTGI